MEEKLYVIKKDGSREEFSEKKIEKVVIAAGLTEEKARALAQKVEAEVKEKAKQDVTTKDIRQAVASELKQADQYAFGLYTWYERTKDHDGKR